MRGTAALLPAKNKLKQIYPAKGTWGSVSTPALKREGNNDFQEQGAITNEKIDPIVAFSKPQPLPPVLGPLVALSLLEAWWTRDRNDDRQVM